MICKAEKTYRVKRKGKSEEKDLNDMLDNTINKQEKSKITGWRHTSTYTVSIKFGFEGQKKKLSDFSHFHAL